MSEPWIIEDLHICGTGIKLFQSSQQYSCNDNQVGLRKLEQDEYRWHLFFRSDHLTNIYVREVEKIVNQIPMTFTKLGFNYNGLQDGLNATQLAEVPNQEEDDKDEDEVEEGEIEEGKMDEGGFDDDEVEEAAAKKGKVCFWIPCLFLSVLSMFGGLKPRS